MRLFLAGHGHELQQDKQFAKLLRRMKANFLVSFAYPEEKRLKWVKKVNDREKGER